MHVICISISKSFAAVRSPSRLGPRFPPPLGSSQWVLFYLFPFVGASQAREFQKATMTTPRKTVQTTFCTVICIFFSPSKSRVFWSVIACFCNVFLQNTVSYKFVAIKPFQNIIFYNVSNSLISPNPWKHRSSIFPCSNVAGQNHWKTLFVYGVFTMFSVKNTVIYTLFGIKSVQNTGFCSVFNALASKNLSKYRYLLFFSFLSVLPLPEAYQNYPLKLRRPKIVKISRKHHLILVSVRNRSWAPPPAKADIATAILTNVIEHLVWLFASQ